MPRKRTWKKAAAKKKTSFKADVGDKYPTDVGHVQPSVPLGVGHVLTPMTSVPAGVISTIPVTVVSVALLETTSNQNISQNDSQITMQILPQNNSQISTQNISENISQEMPNEVQHVSLQCRCVHQSSDSIVFGSFHQGNTKFSSFSRGNQCSCNSLIMLVNSYENFSFSSGFLDQTLVKGDSLYNTILQKLQGEGKVKSKLLMFDELPTQIGTGKNHHKVDKFDTLYGLLVTNREQNNVQTLHECLEQVLQLSSYVMIMIGSICLGLYKASENDYYFFDSHSHGENGLSVCDGKSMLRLLLK